MRLYTAIEKDRELIIIQKNTLPTKIVRDLHPNPIIFVNTTDKLTLSLWTQVCSDVFSVHEYDKNPDIASDIEKEFNTNKIFSDDETFIYAKLFDKSIIENSNELKKAIKDKNIEVMRMLLIDGSRDAINTILQMDDYNSFTTPTYDMNDIDDVMRRNIHNPNYWTEEVKTF